MALNQQNKSNAKSSADAVVTVPDAVIFIPGLTHDATQYPLDEVSLHLANSLDNADNIIPAKFRVGDVGVETLEKSGDTQTATIFREQDGSEAAVAKVYGMNYSSEILGGYQKMPPIVK